ncbi:MAG TPA: PfkB family carbohydrate kinase [Casimicrobiaceae bacterium]|nr:PfkB family carbohydrate kinase [Casimicrobiaceae bacterium]
MALHPASEAALADLRKKAGAKKKLVFVSGNFNVIHPGHLRLLKFAADCGDFLVVGVNNKAGGPTVVPGELRLEGVRAIGIVDYAFLLDDAPEQFIVALKPAIVVKGKEHEATHNPERKGVESYGGQLLFSSGEVTFSSLDLIQREFKGFNLVGITKPLDFPTRHGFALGDLKGVLAKLAGLRVLVIGDLIVDEYLACDALGMSQEDPTIVVTPVLSERFVGGAGIVAAHAVGLGAEASFVSVVGNDPTATYAAEKLQSYGVKATLLRDESRPTTLKQRYRAAGKTLLRVSHLKQHAADQALQEKMLDAVKAALSKSDLVIFADFNYGCLPQPLVDAIVALCGERKVPMAADSQSSSQVGDVSRFRNALLLTPTEREARLALRDFDSGLVVVAEALRQRANAQNIVLTLDSEGVLLHAPSARAQGWLTDRLPALNLAPRDTAGAGDSFLAAAALALVTGADLWRSAYLGSLAAACQVGRIGNTPLDRTDIEHEIDS